MTTDAYPFDPTYGYTLEQLLKVSAPPAPDDYEPFWRKTYAETLAVLPKVTSRPVASPSDAFEVHEVEFNSIDEFRVGGWMTFPKGRPPRGAVVVGHGYGGRGAIDPGISGLGVAAIYPCGRGFDRSAKAGYPKESGAHVVYGIESRETYSHRGCVADIWAAGTVLGERFPELACKLSYYGGSFGGGMGAMVLPWDERFIRGYLDVPSFGNHPLRVTMQCVGSGEAVRQRYLKDPKVLDVLAYFDAATAASRITIPVMVSPAMYDPCGAAPGTICGL